MLDTARVLASIVLVMTSRVERSVVVFRALETKKRCEYGLHPDTFAGRRANFLAFRATALAALRLPNVLSPAERATTPSEHGAKEPRSAGGASADSFAAGPDDAAPPPPAVSTGLALPAVRVLVVQRPPRDRAIANLGALVTVLGTLPAVVVRTARFDRWPLRTQLEALTRADVLVAVGQQPHCSQVHDPSSPTPSEGLSGLATHRLVHCLLVHPISVGRRHGS